MNTTSHRSSLMRISLTLCALAGLVLPAIMDASAARPLQAQVILETPTLHPPIGPCDETYWYYIDNPDDYAAYLTLNALNPFNSTNWAEWLPVLPEAGYYRVEAYIAAHDPIDWCSETAPTIPDDTTDARYTIRHAFGETTVSRDQSPLANQWLDLGEYFFNAGSGGAVILTDLNGEDEFSTTVSFSAMRFTWTRQPPHVSLLPTLPRNVPGTLPPPWVDVLAAQGFDACNMGGIPTMQAWWDQSPYSLAGLYLGGVHYPDDCTRVTADWVAQTRAMGWSFIPTWVGPQSPCATTDYKYKIDEDPAASYLQGRSEADLAAQAARSLGLTTYALGGTIIYYDLEAYSGSNTECQAAVLSFLNGWTERLHELNNRSGVYSIPCSTYAATWATLPNPPDDVWLAVWDANTYDPDQTVWSLPCFPDTLYANHQRIKQYAGGHKETWGGKSLSIDSDVADGEVAMPEIALQVSGSAIQQTGWLSAAQGWLVSAGGLYQTADGGASWQRQPVDMAERASFLPSGAGWAAGAGRLYQRSAGSDEWQSRPLPEVVNGWRVVQLSFNLAGDGVLVMQQPTSTLFSIGKLLRTANGGQTWQVYDLPLAEPLTWVDAQTAWMSGGVAGSELYRTSDGGQSWQAVPLPGELSRASSPVWLGLPAVSTDGTLTLQAARGQVKIPALQVYTSRDGGLSWQLKRQAELHAGAPSYPLPQTVSGLYADGARLINASGKLVYTFDAPVVQLESAPDGLVWVVTRQGTCLGEKGTPGFSCSSQDALWLSVDGGEIWRHVGP